jgi:4-hydroxy-2-oxoheptanedioate aldolase
MKNYVKEKLKNKETVIGTFFELGSCQTVEALSMSGIDFMIIDCEHGPFDTESTLEYVRTAELSNLTPFVRVKDITRPSILKNLDLGAKGLIVPNLETVEEAKKLVEWGKYHPVGKRGVFLGRTSGFGYESLDGNIDEYFKVSNEETMLIPQCETLGCLENIEEIAALEGIDGIFIGPYDLSIALGAPADFNSQKFKDSLNKIQKACKKANKPCFIYTGTEEGAAKLISEGYEGIALSMDISFLINAYKETVQNLNTLNLI